MFKIQLSEFPASLCLMLLALLLLSSINASAQTDQGRITGTITDQTGALVPGAIVLVKNEQTGEERTVTTTDAGLYTLNARRHGLRPASSNGRTNCRSRCQPPDSACPQAQFLKKH